MRLFTGFTVAALAVGFLGCHAEIKSDGGGGGFIPLPAAPPTPITKLNAKIATSRDDARFIFCEGDGHQAAIDLGNQNLSITLDPKKVILGYRTIDAADKTAFSLLHTAEPPYTMSENDSTPTYYFTSYEFVGTHRWSFRVTTTNYVQSTMALTDSPDPLSGGSFNWNMRCESYTSNPFTGTDKWPVK